MVRRITPPAAPAPLAVPRLFQRPLPHSNSKAGGKPAFALEIRQTPEGATGIAPRNRGPPKLSKPEQPVRIPPITRAAHPCAWAVVERAFLRHPAS